LLEEIHNGTGGNALDFEGFLKEVTNRIVIVKLFRVTHSVKRAERLISLFWMLKGKVSSTSLI